MRKEWEFIGLKFTLKEGLFQAGTVVVACIVGFALGNLGKTTHNATLSLLAWGMPIGILLLSILIPALVEVLQRRRKAS